MPVGTSFENSAMKTSFSLSSLQASETPEKGIKTRPFNSLTKKRKEAFRRSWGSSASVQKDEFWSALQANYNYIMDNHLIDNCQEANGEMNGESQTWSFEEFSTQFSELYSWLNSIQEAKYGTEETITDKALQTRLMSGMSKKSYHHKLFNDQANQIIRMHPCHQEEVQWRVSHLNSKWEALESALKSSDCGCHEDSCLDLDHEVKCLHTWIKNIETVLQPVDFRAKWTKAEIEKKASEHKVLHCDIENHRKIVTSLIKLCQRSDVSCNNISAKKIATHLEKRFLLVFLKSMEWQCHIENLSKRDFNQSYEHLSDTEFDEPVSKQPRLTVSSSKSSPASIGNISSEDQIDGNDDGFSFKYEENNRMSSDIENKIVFREYSHLDETSHFTHSNRKAPNQATYYFKHVDTDSDMDKIDPKEEKTDDTHNHEDTSEEEEWTYSASDMKTRNGSDSNSQSSKIGKPSTENINYLVQKAEELVRESPAKRRSSIQAPVNKTTLVKAWLNMDRPDDSCDASGEDDERESQTSEENNESVITYRAQTSSSQNASYVDLESTPKVVRRGKLSTDTRPWSVSCISQLTPKVADEPKSFSTSESALYNLSKNLQEMSGCNGQGNNSTSSTVEESSAVLFEEKCSAIRRKRYKIKKHQRKNKHNSPYHSTTLVKSGSFSGNGYVHSKTDRHSVSDPSALSICHFLCDSTSGADSEDDRKLKRISTLKARAKSILQMGEVRDNSPGKSSLIAAEEQSSSVSEQAWDGFQEEIYLSEQYSESQDSDAARKLLEFGEDYGNFLGSQSDWSASTNPGFSPPFARKMLQMPIKEIMLDSDSDCDSEIKDLLRSHRQDLNSMDQLYKRQLERGLTDYLVNNDVTDVLHNCNCVIEVLTEALSRDSTAAIKSEVQDLLTSWRNLKERVLTMQEYRDLQKEILLLKDTLNGVKSKIPTDALMVNSVDDLTRDIDFYTVELNNLLDHKAKLLTLNVSVHKFIASDKDYTSSFLQCDISELYRIWYDVHSSVLDKLTLLKNLKQSWQMLEKRLDKLQVDLREDEQTLEFLGQALEGGSLSNQVITSLKDVDKLLSESSMQDNDYTKISEFFLEGSCSDSGMSDEGSEHELGERREHRLSLIRKLVRQLETVMSPQCEVRVRMTERLEAAEEELKNLRKRCRSLVDRSSTPESPYQNGDALSTAPGGGDPDDPSMTATATSWLKRVTRISFPLQIALMAILCVACLLEPHCCDNMNTFSLSLTPHLQYVRGPPPV